MSDCETDYARTEYQKTEYEGSNSEADNEETDGAHWTESAGELPEMVAGHSTELPDISTPAVEMQNSSIPPEVLKVLKERWAGWKEAQGSQRKKHWTGIVLELRELELHRGMEKPELTRRLKV